MGPKCDREAIVPIAVRYQDQEAIQTFYKANIATGSGASLPAVYGVTAMQKEDTALLLRPGKEAIVFPGKKGYKKSKIKSQTKKEKNTFRNSR